MSYCKSKKDEQMKQILFMLIISFSFIACSQNDNNPITASSSPKSELTSFGKSGNLIVLDKLEKVCVPVSAQFNGTLGSSVFEDVKSVKVTANGRFQINAENYMIEKSVTLYLHRE